jgi:hypothetical protein
MTNDDDLGYSKQTPDERRQTREAFVQLQHGLCYHCKYRLDGLPPTKITSIKILWSMFPPNFLKYPVHLHHCHSSDRVLGAVHAYCNAVLWQYHGE